MICHAVDTSFQLVKHLFLLLLLHLGHCAQVGSHFSGNCTILLPFSPHFLGYMPCSIIDSLEHGPLGLLGFSDHLADIAIQMSIVLLHDLIGSLKLLHTFFELRPEILVAFQIRRS